MLPVAIARSGARPQASFLGPDRQDARQGMGQLPARPMRTAGSGNATSSRMGGAGLLAGGPRRRWPPVRARAHRPAAPVDCRGAGRARPHRRQRKGVRRDRPVALREGRQARRDERTGPMAPDPRLPLARPAVAPAPGPTGSPQPAAITATGTGGRNHRRGALSVGGPVGDETAHGPGGPGVASSAGPPRTARYRRQFTMRPSLIDLVS
ncbi:hypothetical protein ACSSVZ_005001 [Amorphus sp. MBR-141]